MKTELKQTGKEPMLYCLIKRQDILEHRIDLISQCGNQVETILILQDELIHTLTQILICYN